MGGVVAAVLGGLVTIAGSLVGRVLLALGLSYMTYTGVTHSLNWIRDQFAGYMGQTGATILGLAGILKLDVALGILLAATTARLILDGLTGDTVKKWIMS